MNINGVNGMNGVGPTSQVSSVRRNTTANENAKAVAGDGMELNAQNSVKGSSMNPNEIRIELVNRVRAEIAAGTYYSDAKLEAAMNKMFASFE